MMMDECGQRGRGRLVRRRSWRPALVLAVTIPLVPHVATGQLPSSPEALVTELSEALTARDVEAYASLLSDDFVYMPPPAEAAEPLDRSGEVELTRRFLAAVSSFEASLQIESRSDVAGGVELTLRADFLALDAAGNGYTVSVVPSALVADVGSGWRLVTLSETEQGARPPGHVGSWYALRQALADRSTGVQETTWGQIKTAERHSR